MIIKQILNEEDIKRCVPLMIKSFKEHPFNRPWNKKNAFIALKESFDKSKEFCVFAEEKDKVVGFSFGSVHTSAEGPFLFMNYNGDGEKAYFLYLFHSRFKGFIKKCFCLTYFCSCVS